MLWHVILRLVSGFIMICDRICSSGCMVSLEMGQRLFLPSNRYLGAGWVCRKIVANTSHVCYNVESIFPYISVR